MEHNYEYGEKWSIAQKHNGHFLKHNKLKPIIDVLLMLAVMKKNNLHASYLSLHVYAY